MNADMLGKGGGGARGGRGGGARGGGHHRGGGGRHHHHGGGRRVGRRGIWGGPLPFVYDVPDGIDVDELLAAADAVDEAHAKDVAREVVRQLKGAAAPAAVGAFDEELALLDAELIGQGFGDFGLSSVFNLAANLAQGGLSIYEQETKKRQGEEDKRQAQAQLQGRLQAAISADAAAAQAGARASYSAAQKLPSAEVDRLAAAQAEAAQARAGAGLPPEAQQKRIEAAERAMASATSKAQAAPKDAYALAQVRAWQQTIARLVGGGGAPAPAGTVPGAPGTAAGPPPAAAGPGWLQGSTGPIPNKVIAGGGAVLGLLVLVRAVAR